MFGLPKTTEFNKKIPKQKFYEKLDITPALKRVFVEQIKAIYWTNKIAASTVNLAVGKSVTELEVFKIELTSQSLDLSALQLIDKAIPYHNIFALCYNDRYQLVSSYKSNNTSLDKDCPKASTRGAILKPLLEEGNKRGGDRIRSLFSSLEQPSSQEDWIATQSATARNDGNSTGGSNTLSLNKVSSNSVTLSACKQATSPQGEALEPLATTGSTNDNNITQHSNAENNPLLSHLSSLNSKETGLPRSLTTARNDGNGTEQQLDVGFRVFKLADSNMKDVYYSADEYSQQSLQDFVSNIKEDRTDLDLLFGCLLEWGLPLSMPYSSEKINGFNIHTYNDGDLIASFDENVSEEVIKIIAKRNPLRAVFRDSSFANSPSKINVTEIFKLLSPNTRVKVI